MKEYFPDYKLRVVYNPEEFTAEEKAYIQQQGWAPGRIRAFIKGDTVVFNAGLVRPSEAMKVLSHEVIGHKELPAFFGEDYARFLDVVYRDHAAEIAPYAQRYGREVENAPENQRYVTEEFLADMADARVKPAWWKEFLGWIRQQLRRIFPNLKVTDRDIEWALSRARRRTVVDRTGRTDRTDRTDRTELRAALVDDKANFISALNDYIAGRISKRHPLVVTSQTPPVLLNLRLPQGKVYNRKITLTSHVIEKAIGNKASTTTGEGHLLSIERLKLLPENLYNPVMVLEGSHEGSIVIYTSFFDNANDPVLISLELDVQQDSFEKNKASHAVNSITSIYGKENHNTPINDLLQGKGIYVDMEKAEIWRRAIGVQFPEAFELRSSSPYITIVQNSENVKPDDEKNLKKDDLRSSVRGFGEQEARDIVAVLKPMVGRSISKTDRQYQAYLHELGVEVTEKEAHTFAVIAMRENEADFRALTAENRKKRLEAGKKLRQEYLYTNFPYYRAAGQIGQ